MGIPGPGPAAGPLPGPGGRRADAPSGETGGPVPARSREPPLREAPPLLPLASLIDALKLPPGRWSASILSFAKFFSLPLEGNFLSLIRRRALEAPVRPEAPGAAGENAGGIEKNAEFREALSLAALAARAKGVELSPAALAEYARALLRGRESAPPAGREAEPAEPAGEGDSAAGGRKPGAEPESGEAGPALRDRVLGAQGPLLSLLNRLPGKGGKRWIVLPFSAEGALECCLRVLLAPQAGPAAYRAERMGLDIRRREEPGPAWTFIFNLDTPAGARAASLEVFCRPARAGTEALKRELAGLLDLPPDSVRIRNGQTPVFAEDSRDRTLPSLNKEV